MAPKQLVNYKSIDFFSQKIYIEIILITGDVLC